MASYPRIETVSAQAYTIPTDEAEADGTLSWDSTTIVVVNVRAGEFVGLGYSYTHASSVRLVRDLLAPQLVNTSPLDTSSTWLTMRRVTRNCGTSGLVARAIAAVDNAVWDLKAKVLGLPLCDLLGLVRDKAEVYGSGGFTSYDQAELEARLAEWQELGARRVKMKVGSVPADDLRRVAGVRRTLGPTTELFVDANGAYQRKQALALAQGFAEHGVTWFEEPVSADDRQGLRLIVERAPSQLSIASGEYACELFDFRDLLIDGAVDVLQADVTRCQGVTGFLKVAALCEAHCIPLSTHTAPALHTHLGVSVPSVIHLEYFRDHARIEQRLFDGCARVRDGCVAPDRSALGFGLVLKQQDARQFGVTAS